MPTSTASTQRLDEPAEVGRLVAEGRHRRKLSQQAFAAKLGVSRKTLSDLERGTAEHVSLKTALKALTLAGFIIEATPWRAPTLLEVMAESAAHRDRVDRMIHEEVQTRQLKR